MVRASSTIWFRPAGRVSPFCCGKTGGSSCFSPAHVRGKTNLIAFGAGLTSGRTNAFPLRGRWVNIANPDEVEEYIDLYVHPDKVQVRRSNLRLPCVKGAVGRRPTEGLICSGCLHASAGLQTIPPAKENHFCHLPLHKGGFSQLHFASAAPLSRVPAIRNTSSVGQARHLPLQGEGIFSIPRCSFCAAEY